jgi:very-short-patch-repair endonuclease
MRGKRTNHRDRTVGEIADGQHGVVSRAQLLDAGIGDDSIDRSVSADRLRVVFRGVYAVGHSALTREAWWKAALLACGKPAVLSHHSAAQLWRMQRGDPFPISVIVRTRSGRRHGRINSRRMRLQPGEWMRFDGLRVTTPARTIIDLAGELGPRQLRRLVEQAQDLRRFDAAEIRQVLTLHPRRPGGRALLDLIRLMEPDADGARSHLERLFVPLARRAGLQKPEVNVEIEGRRRDFVWRDSRLVVEVDGYAYHSSRRAMRRDRERDRRLTIAGWRPARFTFEEVALEPTATAQELSSLATAPTRRPD